MAAFGAAWQWLFNVLQNANVLYSIKTFLGGLLALYISFKLDLSQPGWSIMTVYIVSQPLAGMVLSKSLARICGTLVGAVVAVVMVSLFYNAQPFFVAAIALWIGACLYVSIYLREAPAAYGAMLSGYTAAIIGFSSISAPETAFDTATTRCIEILLGIIIATAVSRVVLPRTTGRVFRIRVSNALVDMKRCIVNTLRGHYDDTRGLLDMRKLIADSLALETLRLHASRDTRSLRDAEHLVRALQGRILSLFSLLVSIHDRLALLRRTRPEAAEQLDPLFARIVERVEALAATGNPNERHAKPSKALSERTVTRSSLTSDLLARLPDFEALRKDPELVVEYILILRTIDMLAQWQEVNRLSSLLWSGQDLHELNIPMPPPEEGVIARYRDHSLAKVAALGAMAAVVMTSAFWIITAWPNGSSAATFAGVVSCTAALQDNPARSALRTFRACVFAAIISAIYLFAILPHLEGFAELALAVSVFYVGVGIFIPSPRFGVIASPLVIYGSSFIGYHNVMSPNFADFINSCSALMTGILIAVCCFRLARPVGTEWALRRHMAGIMRDLAGLASTDTPQSRVRFETRMLDRINAIMLRLRPDAPDERERLKNSLTALRIGLNLH